jgi:hypothetical protein
MAGFGFLRTDVEIVYSRPWYRLLFIPTVKPPGVPKIPRNYFTGSHRVTLDNGILLPFCTLFSIEIEAVVLAGGLPSSAVSNISSAASISKMPPVKQYILIKTACTRLQRLLTLCESILLQHRLVLQRLHYSSRRQLQLQLQLQYQPVWSSGFGLLQSADLRGRHIELGGDTARRETAVLSPEPVSS